MRVSASPGLIVPCRQIELPASLFFPRKDDWKRFYERVLGEEARRNWLFMAGSKSFYLSKKLLEEAAGGVAFTPPTDVFCGLWTAALADASTGSTANEAAYTSYARTEIGTANNQTDAWNVATGTTTATVTNFGQISFPASTGGSSALTHLGVLDAATTGNLMYWTDIAATTINNGDTPRVAAGALSLVED